MSKRMAFIVHVLFKDGRLHLVPPPESPWRTQQAAEQEDMKDIKAPRCHRQCYYIIKTDYAAHSSAAGQRLRERTGLSFRWGLKLGGHHTATGASVFATTSAAPVRGVPDGFFMEVTSASLELSEERCGWRRGLFLYCRPPAEGRGEKSRHP